jgi:hypothetical protein
MASGSATNVPPPPQQQPQPPPPEAQQNIPVPQGGGGAGGAGIAGGGGGGGAGGAGGGGGGAGGGAAGAAAPPFALTPALLTSTALDYSTSPNAKLYYKAILPLETKFDLTEGNLKNFLESLRNKATLMNWTMTLDIIKNGVQYNLIEHYGLLSMDDVRQHVMTYNGTTTRHAQNSYMIFACLHDTLTDAARKRVALEQAKFRINAKPDGLLYLKVIVGLAHLDTRATINTIKMRLTSLDIKISQLQDNIIELNEYVQENEAGLNARGETSSDLMVNLFKAYKACRDAEFATWIKNKEDAYNEGRDNFTTDELMSLAKNKYQTLIENGNWMQQTDDQKRIVAMAAQIQALETKKATTTKKSDARKTFNKKNDHGRNKNTKKTSNSKYAWLYEAPKSGQPKEKDIKGVKWYWCPHHGEAGKWVKHTLADCKVRKEKEEGKTNSSKAKDRDNKPPEATANPMQVAGMVAVYPDDDDF